MKQVTDEQISDYQEGLALDPCHVRYGPKPDTTRCRACGVTADLVKGFCADCVHAASPYCKFCGHVKIGSDIGKVECVACANHEY